jgi:hypothetical protein
VVLRASLLLGKQRLWIVLRLLRVLRVLLPCV